MTTRFKLFATVIGVAALGVVAEIRLTASQQKQIEALRPQADRLAAQVMRYRAELFAALQRATAAERPVSLQISVEAAPGTVDASREDGSVNNWLERVRQLKQLFVESPEQDIPELKLLDDQDWLDLARQVALFRRQAVTSDSVDETFARIRERAAGKFATPAHNAAVKFAAAHHGLLPLDPGQLAPFLQLGLDPAILRRYEMRASGPLNALPPTAPIIEQKVAIDELRENRLLVMAKGGVRWAPSAMFLNSSINVALRAFSAANAGQLPGTPEELMPFMDKTDDGVDLPTLKKFWDSPLRKKDP